MRHLSLPLLLSLTLLLGCPSTQSAKTDPARDTAANDVPADTGLPLGAPLTAEGTLDTEALDRLTNLEALMTYPYRGSDFQWTGDLAVDAAWGSTAPFDPAHPIPDMEVPPAEYILPITQPETPPDTRESKEAEIAKDSSGDKAVQPEGGRGQRDAEPRPVPTITQPGPDDWAPIPIPTGLRPAGLRTFTYLAEELTLGGFAALPAGEPAQNPVLILVHGYVPTERYSPDYFAREALWFAQRGYLVLVPDLRNYGASDRVAADEEIRRLGYLRDILHLVHLLRSNGIPEADASRLGIYGHGHGGSLALKAALIAAPQAVMLVAPTGQQEAFDYDIFKAGMAPEAATGMAALYGPPEGVDNLRWYRNMTGSNFLDRLQCPLALYGGDLDPVVPVQRLRDMLSKITPLGIQAQMSTYPRVGHVFYSQHWIDLMTAADNFFAQRLKPTREAAAIGA